MIIGNKKGASEILSYIIVILIVVGVVGMISEGILPAINKSNSQKSFQESKNYIEQINIKIKEALESPVGSTTTLNLDLENLFLEIKSEDQTIEIFHEMSGDYYQEGLLITEGERYTFREMEKLIVGLNIEGYEVVGDLYITNTKTEIYFKKLDRNKIQITRDIDSTEIINLERERPGIEFFVQEKYLNYKKNVESDSGEIINSINAINYLNFVLTNSLYNNLVYSTSTDFGIKKDIDNKISKMYDISIYRNNSIQEEDLLKPIYNDGIEFTSNESYLNSGNHESLRMTNEFTVSAWIKTNTSSSSNQYFLRRYDSTNNKRVWGFIVRANTNHVSTIMSSTGSNASYSNGNTNVLDNNWHNVLFTHKNGTVKIYVNGVLDVTSSNYSELFYTDTELHINVNNINKFTGKIDNINIFNKDLNQEEISLLYNFFREKYE